jgi:tetratricopeptide (TPR) repeat protein
MIENREQYEITKNQIAKFEAALVVLQNTSPDPSIHPQLHQAQINAVQSQLEDLQQEIKAYELRQNIESLEERAIQLENMLHQPNTWHELRSFLMILIESLQSTGQITESIKWLKTGISQSQLHKDPETTAKLKIQLGREYILQGNYTSARDLLKQGVSYFENDLFTYKPVLNTLAEIAISKEQWAMAEELSKRTLEILSPEEWRERGISYSILGSVAHALGNSQHALNYFKEGLRWWQLGNEPQYTSFGLLNLGNMLRSLKRYEEAKDYYMQAISIYEQVDFSINQAYAQISLGNIYLLKQQWRQAIEQYYKSEDILLKNQQLLALAGLYNNLGMAYAGSMQWKHAIRTYQQSISLWTELENFHSRANSFDNLGLTYMSLRQYEDAIRIFRNALEDIQRLNASDKTPLYTEILSHITDLQAMRDKEDNIAIEKLKSENLIESRIIDFPLSGRDPFYKISKKGA